MLAFITKNHALIAVRKPSPTLRRNWALIRVRLAGICNTDVEILRGYHDFRGVPGHEFVGEVVSVGDGGNPTPAIKQAQSRWIGRRVTGDINVSCAAYGYAYDFKTAKQAHDAAMGNCNGSCKQVVATQKGCVAFAIDGHKPCGPLGYANGSGLGSAQNTALKSCYQNGGRDCMIRAWVCDAKG